MKVALFTGPCPRGQCGVGDYVALLADALNAIGIESQIIDSSDCGLLQAFGLHRAMQNQNFDIVQIHYPSLGFGTKLGPQAIALLRRCVITLHETSQVHILRRLAMIPFSLWPRHVIFFSSFERSYGLKWAPWLSGISSLIPPPSNIRKIESTGPRRLDEIVSFGLIRPGNGHDQILRLAALIKAAGLSLRIRVIGTPQSAKFIPYFEDLQKSSCDLPIVWEHGLGEEEVAKKLAVASIAYLPYPKGAAELRSSLKAALLNRLAIVTTRGTQTPRNLEGVVRFCRNPEEALDTIRTLLESPLERQRLADQAGQYVRDWTWERTAELHAEVYERILSRSRIPARSLIDAARLTDKGN
jgi:glycosyltransferase involved in cell wall biosynthesis